MIWVGTASLRWFQRILPSCQLAFNLIFIRDSIDHAAYLGFCSAGWKTIQNLRRDLGAMVMGGWSIAWLFYLTGGSVEHKHMEMGIAFVSELQDMSMFYRTKMGKPLPPTAQQNLTMAFQQFHAPYWTKGKVEEHKIWETASVFFQKCLRKSLWNLLTNAYSLRMLIKNL